MDFLFVLMCVRVCFQMCIKISGDTKSLSRSNFVILSSHSTCLADQFKFCSFPKAAAPIAYSILFCYDASVQVVHFHQFVGAPKQACSSGCSTQCNGVNMSNVWKIACKPFVLNVCIPSTFVRGRPTCLG